MFGSLGFVGWRLRAAAVALMVMALAMAGLGPVQAAQTEGHHGDIGEIETFATVPVDPGFPEGVVVHGNRVFVSGPARFGTAGTGPSAIQVYDRKNGALKQTIQVTGEALAFEHALEQHGRGCLWASLCPEHPTGSDPLPQAGASVRTGELWLAAAGPAELFGGDARHAVLTHRGPYTPPITNDIAFDNQGNAYVTDLLQATIWRYPAGGGAPQIWFQDAVLEGGGFFPFGPNGIRLNPARHARLLRGVDVVGQPGARHDLSAAAGCPAERV